MKVKRFFALALTCIMVFSMIGCSKGEKDETADSNNANATATPGVVSSSDSTETEKETETPNHDELVTIDFYDGVANYQGIQGGWFGKLIKDKFNIELNIIAPNISGGGNTLFQTRSAAGNLGDLIVCSKSQLKDCIDAGIIMDISDYYNKSENLMKYSLSVDAFKDYAGTDKVYGIPTTASLSSPLTPSTFGTQPSIGNFIRFDYFQEIGAPELKNEDDLLNALKAIQDLHPTTADGAKVYGISIFKDWDSIYMKYPISMCSNYGFNPGKEGSSFILMNSDGSESQSIDTDNGIYYNQLKFLFKANQMGLVDPDSSSMTWDMLTQKTRNGEVIWGFWPWATISQYNTLELSQQGSGFYYVPVETQTVLTDGLNPYGQDSNVMAIGSKCKNPERIIEFMDWLASDEGHQTFAEGIKGVIWDNDKGYCDYTEVGEAIHGDPDNALAPDEIGGGNYFDGAQQFNTRLGNDNDINPLTGETFSASGWQTRIEKTRAKLDDDWTAKYGFNSPVEYMMKNNLMVTAPGCVYTPPADSSDIATKRALCGEAIVNASWNMVFAKDEAEFNAIWADMKEKLNGYGYAEVLENDRQIVEGYKASRAETIAASQK